MSKIDNEAWEWLNKNELSYNIWDKKYRYNGECFDAWLNRVSGGDLYIKTLIFEKKFIFGGRTLANRGTTKGSFSNCYSIGYVPDSLEGIMDTASKIAMTFKAQGGQGLSLSKIRPKGSLIHNTFKSDGIVPFMEIFNTVTESISQGGSRKGALMMSLDINHPEAETFMTIKSDLKKINKANLSMEIDDYFMVSLKYDPENRKKFKLLAEQACKYAEPGVLFTNRLRNYNLMEFVNDYQIETTNPCGEQPLPKHGACNLASINVSEYVLNPFTENFDFDWNSLERDVFFIVKAMDDVLEENIQNHALQEQREASAKWRNVGIGIMGLHDALIKMGYTYGDINSISFAGDLMKFLFKAAVTASARLGAERGNFPGYSSKVWQSSIIKEAFTEEEINKLKKQGHLRNCSLLSIAPTGSIGTMWNVSTGIEPWFSFHYTRHTKSLDGKETSYEVWAPVIEESRKHDWAPHCRVEASSLTWQQHIDMQAECQHYVDTSISKTINMPKGTTPEKVEELYKYAWKKGLKGVTIYVDGSRDPILSNTPETKVQESEVVNKFDSIEPVTRKELGKKLCGISYKCKNACGGLYIQINNTPNNDIVEVFCNPTKSGGCHANLNGLSRMVSDALRSGIKVPSIIESLGKVQCQACIRAKAKGEELDGTSCADIIAKCLQDRYNELHNNTEVEESDSNNKVCPECGKPLRHESGCLICECGYSKCGD